jgi:hypothetical protein
MSRIPKPSGRNPLFDKSRSTGSYLRKKGQRIPTKTILILCEGKETEPNYFEGIKSTRRLRTVRIEIVRGGEDLVTPINLVNTALERIRLLDWDNERDEAWCVFDMEAAGTNPTLKQAVLRAKGKIRLAISNPACEYWFLIHFVSTNREFKDADEVIQVLKNHIPNYSKKIAVYNYLEKHTQQGLSHAKRLRGQAEHHWEDFPNPSTGIDQLVQLLLTLDT